MTESDETWEVVELGDVCDPVRGATFKASSASDAAGEGHIACLTTSGVQDRPDWSSRRYIPARNVKPAQKLRVGDLMVSTANSKPLVGKSCLVDSLPLECTFGAFVTVLRPKQNVEPKFLAHAMRSPLAAEFFYRESSNTTGISNLKVSKLLTLRLPLPPLSEQRRLAGSLSSALSTVARARAAAQARLAAAERLSGAMMSASLEAGPTERRKLRDCLVEVRGGVGDDWSRYPVLGATRAGLADGKVSVGKSPERYKLADPVTVFYNPMRILLGSIALVDDADPSGITSPDYVVLKGRDGVLDTRWFYHWFRSVEGANLINSLTRGAVRERILFKRLATGEIDLPPYDVQVATSLRMRATRPLVEAAAADLASVEALPATVLRRAFAAPATERPSVFVAADVRPKLPQGIFFKRGAIVTYIVDKLHRRPTFGRVHLEKNLYLSEAYVGVELHGRYERAAAGPLDSASLYRVESLAEKKHWFYKRKRGAEGFFYRPGNAAAGRVSAAVAILGDAKKRMDHLLAATAAMHTERVEIFATVFAAWNDRIIAGEAVSDGAVIEDVRERWHSSKQRFAPERLQTCLDWMRANDFAPRGIGPQTIA